MDNGLIFPYPSMSDHGESVILTTHKHPREGFAFLWCVVAWDLIW